MTASLDGDDRPDLLVAAGDRVIPLHGRGDGTFEVGDAVRAGPHAVDLARGDLDEDGFEDLAVANHETDHLTLLFGAPDGGLGDREPVRLVVGVSPHPHAVRAQDVDGDGHADLLVDDRHAAALRLFRGRGDGRFEPPTPIPVGGDPYRGMCLADVDGDGSLDLLTPNPDHVSLLRGDGSGAFVREQVLRPRFAPFSVIAADLDGDGSIDVAAGSGEGRGGLAVWLGTGGRALGAADHHDLARGPTRLAAADLTGDRCAELIVTSYLGGSVTVLVGGDVPTLRRMEVEGNPYGAATGDYDGDGRVDFAVANDGSHVVTVFLSRASSEHPR